MSLTRTHKATVRLTPDRDAGREIVTIIGPGVLIGFRLHGTRKVVETTVRACYDMAVKAAKARERALKLTKKRPKRKR